MGIVQAFTEDRRGQRRLWPVFWVYGVLLSHALFAAILYFYRSLDTLALALVLLGFLVYTAWIMRVVFVNAFNVDNELYGHLARALTVAWSLNAVLVSVFLFLGHFGLATLPL